MSWYYVLNSELLADMPSIDRTFIRSCESIQELGRGEQLAIAKAYLDSELSG